MKLSNIFFYAVWFLLYSALLPLPQSFALDQNTSETRSDREMVHLRWKNLGEGITYQFQLAKDSEFRQILIDQKCARAEIAFPPPNTSGINYVRIRPIDSAGSPGNFFLPQRYEIGPLKAPLILSPEEISEVRDIDVTIEWRPVPRAAGYHVIIARDREFKKIVVDNAKISNTSLRIENLDFGTYFLKVSTLSEDAQETAFSDTRSFIVAPHPNTEPFAGQPN